MTREQLVDGNAGVLGSTIGIRSTLWVAAIGSAASFLWLLPSPIPSMMEIPEPLAEVLA